MADVRRQIPIVAIIGLALAVRLWGIGFGLPHTLARPDEDAVLGLSLLVFGRHLNPGFFHWPSLFIYAVCALYVIYFNIGRVAGWFSTESSFLHAASLNPTACILIARGLSVATGVMTVWTVDRLGARVFDRTTGLVGALFLAVAMLHARDSHFGVTDVAATSLVCMSVLSSVAFAQAGQSRHAMTSALWAGLAASTKYNAAFAVLPGLWAIVTRRSGGSTSHQRRRLFAFYVAVATAAFVLGTPYSVLDFQRFRDEMIGVFARFGEGQQMHEHRAWVMHLSSSLWYGMGAPMLAAGIVGIAIAARRLRPVGAIVAIFPITYFIVIGAGHAAFARYVLPVVPFLCLGAAHVTVLSARRIAEWSQRPARTAMLAWTIATVIAIPPIWSIVRIDRLLVLRDNRLIVADWIRHRFPDGATMYQGGAVYGHVQMKTADPIVGRYYEISFDEASAEFRGSDGGATGKPELIVLPEAPLPYCDVSNAVRRIVADSYQIERTFTALDASDARLVYDRDDAFFVPLAGLAAVDRPGPNLTIYRLREQSTSNFTFPSLALFESRSETARVFRPVSDSGSPSRAPTRNP